jgi:hypothetical protein
MWSHYAGSHAGIVLEFDVREDLEFFCIPLNVKYTDAYEPLNYLRDGKKAVQDNLKTKASPWSYEEEIRIYKKSSGYWRFNPACLTRIFFGCKADDNEIEQVIKHCRISGLNHVKYLRAAKEHSSFSLRVQPIY